ncbi:MAG TPA: succinyl-diaminopimelate desuccinylase [Alphaproteobacteria bacterium]|nr:succinyl-diaminopimelate desuccinylase [Alphaproteobacteria bacterium]
MNIALSPVVALTAKLVGFPSVTPKDEGALPYIAEELKKLGFQCDLMAFGDGDEQVLNLVAQIGGDGPHLAFAGHTDVVPAGARDKWRSDPFEANIEDDMIIGRSVADMKGAIAAFVVALGRFLEKNDGRITMVITGDEEGKAVNGTIKQVAWLKERNIIPDLCLIGEPTNPDHMGEMIKVGRRGSFNGIITVKGKQGHVAYPDRTDNPVPKLLKILNMLSQWQLDEGTEHFQASRLEVTSIDVGNKITNVIPAKAEARFNIRFNDLHDENSLRTQLQEKIMATGFSDQVEAEFHCSGASFVMQDTTHAELLQDVVEEITSKRPVLSTTGGTSDGRFLKDLCPVMEFGVVGATMHQVDERVRMSDLDQLADIYLAFMQRFFQEV